MPVLSAHDYRRQFRSNIIDPNTGQPVEPEEWDYEPEVGEEFDAALAEELRSRIIRVTPSGFVEFAVKVPDKLAQQKINFSFENRRYLKMPYDTASKRTLYKCGRQVEKSTLLGNKSLAYACLVSSFNVLYVSPTNQQTKTFSQDRLKETIETSDVLKAWTTTKMSDNVFLKKFVNRSQITLRYAYHNADRTRGIPADLILLDEIQDIITDNIPVIEQCASHSPYKLFIYAGTPKSYDNAIEHYWQKFSTQNEWVVPCDCRGGDGGRYWNILGEENIGKQGLICARCGKLIHSMHEEAQWASMNPGIRQTLSADGLYEGFRIPQLMVPWIPWHEILDNRAKYPRHQFYNEVLGLSFDTGTRPLTRQDLVDNCWRPERTPIPIDMTQESLQQIHRFIGGAYPVWAGIDWGTGEGSYTVMCLATYIGDMFVPFYYHRFEGQETEPPIQLDMIEKIISSWNVQLVGTDYGGGFDRNDHLQRKFGRQKIVKYQYSTPGQKVKWDDGMHRYLVHRTEVMSDIFNAIKRKNVFLFPKWEHFEPKFGADFLNIFSEYSETQRQIQYHKSPDVTDDAFHATLLCFLVSLIQRNRLDVLNPTQKVGLSAFSAED